MGLVTPTQQAISYANTDKELFVVVWYKLHQTTR